MTATNTTQARAAGRKVVLVGDGAVGSSYAFAALQQRLVDELVIVDIVKERTQGDALDLEDVTAVQGPAGVRSGEYADTADADLVVITAGAPQKPGQSRLELVGINRRIIASIVEPIVAAGFGGIFLVASNPVDVLTEAVRRYSGFPAERVIGSGTSLDSARLRGELGRRLGIDARDVHVSMLGEHGDSGFAGYSAGRVGGAPLLDITAAAGLDADALAAIEDGARRKAYRIIDGKGATFYGIASCLARITRAVLGNERAVLEVGAHLNGQYGAQGVYLGTPAVIGRAGIERILEVPLSHEEQERMRSSYEAVSGVVRDALGAESETTAAA